jgi:hypothetical protein
LKTLRAARDKPAQWLTTHEDKIGAQGKPIKSNVTDNDSAKMKSSHGIIQGYDGVAMVDQKHQVIVHGEAFGAAQEPSLLIPMIEGTRERFQALGEPGDLFHRVRFVADTGFYTEAGLRYLFEHGIDAYLPDPHFRQRDPRFRDAKQHTPERERAANAKRRGRTFRPKDFVYDAEKGTCTCPAGHPMYLKNSRFTTSDGYQATSFQARLTDCRVCPLRKRCLQREDQVSSRQVYFFHGRSAEAEETFTDKMKRKIDTWSGRMLYGLRVAVVEPVFGNVESNIGLHRFTLRGKPKVNAQWLLYCMVHNIGKLCRYGYGFR